MSNSIFFISGEASGDLHGANLARAILKKNSNVTIYAWGGDEMTKAGVQVLKHYRELAFMGFVEVIRNILKIYRNFDLIKKQIVEVNPNVVVLIDYPGFNLRLLPWLKSQNKKIVYYIAPQAWAWKENRVKKMATYIDKLAVILPFEEAFFSVRGVHTEFVGHPLLQVLDQTINTKKSNSIALLPGSRKQEIHHILPIMLSVISDFPNYEFIIAGMSYLGDEFYNNYIHSPNVKVIYDQSTEILAASHLALVSSGTATLQTAL
ncbi:MAG: lipid-A-disaccharide synthase, partial [Chitinophagales bacterium]